MALDSSNVRQAVTGAISVGATSTTAPTTAASALDAGFKDLGYVGEDGISETRDRTTTSIRAWQNSDEVRKSVTESSLTYSFTMIETKEETVETFYGASATTGVAPAGSIVVVPSSTGGRKSFVIDVVDGSDLVRVYIPQGEVTEVGEVTYANGEPIGYPVTITAYPDTTIGGSAKIFYSDLGLS